VRRPTAHAARDPAEGRERRCRIGIPNENVRVVFRAGNEERRMRPEFYLVVHVVVARVSRSLLEDEHVEAGPAQREREWPAARSAADDDDVDYVRSNASTPAEVARGSNPTNRHPTVPRLPPYRGALRKPAMVIFTSIARNRRPTG
jgi:hypothetical protein